MTDAERERRIAAELAARRRRDATPHDQHRASKAAKAEDEARAAEALDGIRKAIAEAQALIARLDDADSARAGVQATRQLKRAADAQEIEVRKREARAAAEAAFAPDAAADQAALVALVRKEREKAEAVALGLEIELAKKLVADAAEEEAAARKRALRNTPSARTMSRLLRGELD